MNPTRLLILIVVIVAAAWGLHHLADSTAAPGSEVREPQVAEQPLLPGLPADLRAVELEHPQLGYRIRIVREAGDRWVLTEPIGDRAEPAAVETLLRVLFGGGWTQAPASWTDRSDADLGLDPARLALRADFDDGGTARLRLGAEEATGDWQVAERDGARIRLGIGPARLLQRPYGDWRDRRVIERPGAVTRIEWRPQDRSGWTLAKRDGHWHLVEPIQGPVDSLQEQSIARMLGSRVSALPDSLADPETAEALRAGDTLRFQGPQGEQVLHLREGTGLLEGRDFLLPVQRRDFTVLELAALKLRSLRVFTIEAHQVVSLRIRRGARELVLRRRGAGWAVQGGRVLAAADPDRGLQEDPYKRYTDELLDLVGGLRIENARPCPQREPDGRILLSRSVSPVERGGEILVWWREGDTSLAAVEGSDACVAVTNFNLDEGVRGLLEALVD